MRLKKLVIITLVAVNLVLLATLLSTNKQGFAHTAYAQASGRGGKYLAVTAEYTPDISALVVLHTGRHIMTAMTFSSSDLRSIENVSTVDVAAHLGQNSKGKP